MALNIQVQTEEAVKAVEALAKGIEALATKTSAAGGKVSKSLDFSSSAKSEFAALRSEFSSFSGVMLGYAKSFNSVLSAVKKQAGEIKILREADAAASLAAIQHTNAVREQTEALKSAVVAGAKFNAEQKEMQAGATKLQKALMSVETEEERLARTTAELNKMAASSPELFLKMDRAMLGVQKAARSAGTDAEKFLATIQRQNAEAAKSPAQLAAMRSGFAQLSEVQKQVTLDTLAEIEKRTAAEKKAASEFASIWKQAHQMDRQINRSAAASNTALWNEAHAEDRDRTRQFLSGITSDWKKYVSEHSTLLKQAEQADANIVRQFYAKRKADLKRELDAETAMWREAQAENRKFDKLRSEGMSVTQGLMTAQEKHNATLARMQTLLNGGHISQTTFNRAMSESKATLGEVSARFHLMEQGAAGFRAALLGAGLGFGIFSGSTIVFATGVYALVKALRASVEVGAEFADEFTRVAVIAEGGTDAYGKFTGQAIILRKTMMDLSGASTFTSSEVAQAAKSLAQAGQNIGQIISTLPSVLNLSTIEQIDPSVAAEKLVNVMASFHIQASGAVDVANLLTRAAVSSTTTITQLGTALGQVGTTAAGAGISLRDTLSVLALLRQVGIAPSKTGTDFRNMIQSLSVPTTKAAEALKKLNINVNEFWEGDAFHVPELLTAISGAFSKISKQEQIDLADKIFGKRSAGAVLALSSAGDELKRINAAMDDTSVSAKGMAAAINNNVKAQLIELSNVIKNILIGAFDEYSGSLTGVITDLKSTLQENGPAISKAVAEAATTIISDIQGVISVWTTLRDLTKAPVIFGMDTSGLTGIGDLLTSPLAQAKAMGQVITDTFVSIPFEADKAISKFDEFHKAAVAALSLPQEQQDSVAKGLSTYLDRQIEELKNAEATLARKQLFAFVGTATQAPGQKGADLFGAEEYAAHVEVVRLKVAELQHDLDALGEARFSKGMEEFSATLDQLVDKVRNSKPIRDLFNLPLVMSTMTIKGPSSSSLASSLAEEKARAKQLASEIKNTVTEYEKLNFAPEETNRGLAEMDSLLKAIHNPASRAAEELKALGVSVGEGEQAIAWKKREVALQNALQLLGQLNPAYKNLKVSQQDSDAQALSSAESYNQLTQFIQKLNLPLADQTFLLEKLKQGMADTDDGTNKFKASLQKLGDESARVFAEWDAPHDFAAQIKGFEVLDPAAAKLRTSQAAAIFLNKELGGSFKTLTTDAQLYAEIEQAIADITPEHAAAVDMLRKAFDELKKSRGTGKLEEENAILAERIKLTGQSSETQYAYNKALDAYGSTLEGMPEGFINAARAGYRLQQEMDQINEAQGAFKTFAEGAAHAFSGLFDGTTHGFKGMIQKIKDSFKQLLAELIFMAARNAIVLRITGQGAGNTSGFFGAIAQGFSGLFGGGSSAGGQGGGFGSLIGNFLGLGGGGTTSAAGGQTAGGGNLFGMLGGVGQSGSILNTIGGWLGIGTAAAGSSAALAGTGVLLTGAGGYGAGATGITGLLGGGLAPTGAWGAGGVSGMLGYGGGTATAAAPLGTSAASSFAIPIIGWIAAAIASNAMLYSAGYKPEGGTLKFGEGGSVHGGGVGNVGAGFNAPSNLLDKALLGLGLGGKLSAVLSGEAITTFLFGRKTPKIQSSGYTFNTGSGTGSEFFNIKEKGGIFASDKKYTKTTPLSQELQAQIAAIFKLIKMATADAASALRVALPDLVQGTFTVKQDKTGKVTDQFSTVNGIVYHEDQQAHATRMEAENLLKVISSTGSSIGTVADAWRSNADTLLDGARMLFAAQTDISNREGLLGNGVDDLAKTAKLVESFQKAGESLVDTYTRIKASVTLVDETLGSFNIATGKTREEYVQFSAEIVKSLGGLDAAKEKLASFAQAFGDLSGLGAYQGGLARAKRNNFLDIIGLDPSTTKAQFADLFRAALPTLNSQQVADWINAGAAIAAVSNALDAMRDQANGTEKTLRQQIDEQISGIEALGASEAELAQARAYGNQIIQKALGDFMFGIEGQIAAFTGRELTHQLQEITNSMNANLHQAMLLGASEQQLARIRQLAGFQQAAAINQVRTALLDLVSQFYAPDASASSSLQARADAEQQLYDAEMQRYSDAQDAIKEIDKFLKDLATGDLAPGSWKDRLGAAGGNFNELLLKAQGGDKDALSQITGSAQKYLELASQYYGSTTDYNAIYQMVTNALRGLQGALGEIQPPTGGSGGGGSSSSSVDATSQSQAASARFQLALAIAQKIGDLHMATGLDINALAVEFGVKIKDLADAFGITTGAATQKTITELQVLSGALGMSMTDLINELGLNFDDLAGVFNVKVDELMTGNLAGLAEFSAALGVTMIEAVGLLGINITDLAVSFGISIDALTAASVPAIAAMAVALHTSSSELITALGINISDLAVAFGIQLGVNSDANFAAMAQFAKALGLDLVTLATSLGLDLHTVATDISSSITAAMAAIPALSDATVAGLQPFLEAIRTADSSASLHTAMQQLSAFVLTLPTGQAALLRPILEGLGFTFDTGNTDVVAAVSDQTTILTSTRDISGSILTTSGEILTSTNALKDEIFAHSPMLAAIRDSIALMVTGFGFDTPAANDGEGSGIVPPDVITPPVTPENPPTNQKSSAELVASNEKVVAKLSKIEKGITEVARITANSGDNVANEQRHTNQHLGGLRREQKHRAVVSTGSKKGRTR